MSSSFGSIITLRSMGRLAAGLQMPVQPGVQCGNEFSAQYGIDTQVPPVVAGKGRTLDGVLLSHDQWLAPVEGRKAVFIVLGVIGKGMDFRQESETFQGLAEAIGIADTGDGLNPGRRRPCIGLTRSPVFILTSSPGCSPMA